MCGIFGTIIKSKNGLWNDEEGFIQNLMVVGAVRGDHGTGTMWVPGNDPKGIHSLKIAGNPYNLLQAPEWSPYWKEAKAKAQAFVGHHRYATRGKHTTENTHPFAHNHITMVHNGTIHWGLSKYEKMDGVEVDSHALTIAIAEEGLQVLSDMSGAFACVWHDAKDGTLNIAKNDQRPLAMVKTADGNYFFASEGPMLAWTLSRVAPNKKWEKVPIENGKQYKFHLENLGEPEVSPLPEKKPTHSSYGTYYGGSYQERAKASSERKEKGTSFEVTEEVDFEVVRFFRIYSYGQLRYTYLCKTTEDEACWFTSIREFSAGDKLRGNIGKPVINRWTEDWTTLNTPWYPVDPNSVGRIGDTTIYSVGHVSMSAKEFRDMRMNGCVDCGVHITAEELFSDRVDCFEIGHKRYAYMCAACNTHYKNRREH